MPLAYTGLRQGQSCAALREPASSSPCLTIVVVSPCGARTGISVGHYIVVKQSLGGVGGRRSVMPRALSTCRARGEPGVTPVRCSPCTQNVTWRIVSNADQASLVDRFVLAAFRCRSNRRSSSVDSRRLNTCHIHCYNQSRYLYSNLSN